MKALAILVFIAITSFVAVDKPVIDKQEAKKAYEFLNKIRANPADYASIFRFIKTAKISNTQLVWNDTLARVAEAKALDMATQNYFGHVDKEGKAMNYYINQAGYTLKPQLLKSPRMNSYESIAAGMDTAEEVITTLIIDDGVPTLGHRKHLLGMESYAKTTDIGIGFVRGTDKNKYSTYVSIIIASH